MTLSDQLRMRTKVKEAPKKFDIKSLMSDYCVLDSSKTTLEPGDLILSPSAGTCSKIKVVLKGNGKDKKLLQDLLKETEASFNYLLYNQVSSNVVYDFMAKAKVEVDSKVDNCCYLKYDCVVFSPLNAFHGGLLKIDDLQRIFSADAAGQWDKLIRIALYTEIVSRDLRGSYEIKNGEIINLGKIIEYHVNSPLAKSVLLSDLINSDAQLRANGITSFVSGGCMDYKCAIKNNAWVKLTLAGKEYVLDPFAERIFTKDYLADNDETNFWEKQMEYAHDKTYFDTNHVGEQLNCKEENIAFPIFRQKENVGLVSKLSELYFRLESKLRETKQT